MRAVIFANGILNEPRAARAALQEGDVVIAADGGARYCQELGITPAVVIGDFDSLTESDLAALEEAGAEILRYPHRKDETDLELALLHAQETGCRQALVFGGLGLRWDQTLANVLLPAHDKLQDLEIVFQDGGQRISLVRDKSTVEGKAGATVSLIPIGGDALGVTTSGLEYPLDDERLHFGTTRGVSNVMLGISASLEVRQGLLLCVVISEINDQAARG